MKSKRIPDDDHNWPGGTTYWIDAGILYASIPFTWNIPAARARLRQRSFEWDHAIIGGPAAYLMPEAFDDMDFVTIQKHHPGAMAKVNPMAAKTTSGCIRSCGFCAVPRMEGKIREFETWPNRPILIDNNLLAASREHFDLVIDALKEWEWCDFNQGLDARLLTDHHAMRFAELCNPMIRLALDSKSYMQDWTLAYERLRKAGIYKKYIRSYVICGFGTDPQDAWERCGFVEARGIKALPMWYHELRTLEHNTITEDQKALGWTDYERRKILQWHYQHKKARKY